MEEQEKQWRVSHTRKTPIIPVILGILVISVIWLGSVVSQFMEVGYTVVKASQLEYMIVKTDYGNFPVAVKDQKNLEDGVEITLNIINPLIMNFKDVEIRVTVGSITTSKIVDLKPSVNAVKVKIASSHQLDKIKIFINLDSALLE